MKKKILCLILATVFIIPLLTAFRSVSARSFITSASNASGSDYTDNKKLADTLTAIFKGDIDLYSTQACTKEITLPLGSSLSSSSYFVKNKTTGTVLQGWQCYIYGNAVYNRLFNEVVQNGSALVNSKIVITGGKSSVSYSLFQNAGVRCGAYIRTTPNKNGSYTGSTGHSIIVLAYNESHITYLEGNANGNGLARITKETWSEFNSGELSGRSRYICHVVQPTDEKFDEFYPLDNHTHEFSIDFETKHPHKEYKYCACGYKTYTQNTKTVESCVDCFPPQSDNPDDYDCPTRTLKYSSGSDLMSGTDVAWVQAVLFRLGYSVTIDGKYGSGSCELIKSFQSENGLTVDGQCGPATIAKLLEMWEKCKHVHSYTYTYDTKHPHKEFKICECGNQGYTGATKMISTCAECYPVGSATITTFTSKAHPQTPFKISWNPANNAKEYKVKYIDRTGSEHLLLSTTATTAEITFSIEGNYYVFIESVGINGDKKQSEKQSLEVCHTYKNESSAKCTVCGYDKPTYTPGDVDGIAGIGIDDAIFLLFAINFPESYPANQPMDFDGNGKLEIDDAIYLLFHANFPESYPLH